MDFLKFQLVTEIWTILWQTSLERFPNHFYQRCRLVHIFRSNVEWRISGFFNFPWFIYLYASRMLGDINPVCLQIKPLWKFWTRSTYSLSSTNHFKQFACSRIFQALLYIHAIHLSLTDIVWIDIITHCVPFNNKTE